MVLVDSDLEVRRFRPEQSAEWDAFVARSVDGTLMHTRRFLEYHPPGKFHDHSLYVVDGKQRWQAAMTAAEVMHNGQKILHSHPGASCGGLVVAESLLPEQLDAVVSAVTQYARDAEFDAIRMRTAERIFRRRNLDELDIAYFRAGFVIEGRELSSALCLDGDSRDALLARWRQAGRQNLRVAERMGITARLCEDYEEFWSLLSATLGDRHQTRPTHTLAEIQRLRELLPGKILLVGGYLDDRLISGTVLFLFNEVAAHTFYMAQDYAFSEYHSLNLVLLTAADLCRQRGLRWLNFGISSIPGTRGQELNHGLYRFKRSCGGEGVTRDMWLLRL